MNFTKLKKLIAEAKMVITTVSFIIASIVGGYQIITKYFVTKAYAKELITDVTNQLNELKKQTVTNHSILTEMRLIRLEAKISRGEHLTPTESRVYDRLRKEYMKNQIQ